MKLKEPGKPGSFLNQTMERKKKFRSIEEFGAYLESEGIETDLFGKDEAKSLEDLF